MKVRTGFVSNSSSSSYVLVLRESDYNNLTANADPLTLAVLKYLGVAEGKLGDMKIRAISWMEGNYSSFEYFDGASEEMIDAWVEQQKKENPDYDPEYYGSPAYDCWEDFVTKASEVGFKTSADC